MTPKIIGNYPNLLLEHELKFNIKFLKNFCFNEGVEVKRVYIANEDDYIDYILEKNFFAGRKQAFCLLQQITPDDIIKYFVFGIKFDDFYVKVIIKIYK
jgi:hypothetical protein